ncbi:unnamed protein product [Paramecium octaurelia]|uniref:Uncharacterized protein n=1 Tax=Paramecium octaurelia TaxID=43137 RepID=A0A8S1YH32_PAROT|nr:unnamed protein product [Paramecium octaurelia]
MESLDSKQFDKQNLFQRFFRKKLTLQLSLRALEIFECQLGTSQKEMILHQQKKSNRTPGVPQIKPNLILNFRLLKHLDVQFEPCLQAINTKQLHQSRDQGLVGLIVLQNLQHVRNFGVFSELIRSSQSCLVPIRFKFLEYPLIQLTRNSFKKRSQINHNQKRKIQREALIDMYYEQNLGELFNRMYKQSVQYIFMPQKLQRLARMFTPTLSPCDLYQEYAFVNLIAEFGIQSQAWMLARVIEREQLEAATMFQLQKNQAILFLKYAVNPQVSDEQKGAQYESFK